MIQSLSQVILAMVFLTAPAFAGHPHGGSATDASTYEAITGDSADDDRALWDSFYKTKSNAFGKEAVGFLKDHVHEVKKGRAFVPAMGEGRNAIYLAKHGFTVDGNDLSEVAVEHALDEAKAQHVTMKGVVADLTEYRYPENYYDFVMVSLFYMDDLVPKFKKTVKKGGYIMFYEKLDIGHATAGNSPEDFLVKSQQIKTALKDFDIKIFKEYKDHDVDVVGVLARKL
jgi:tellurite methyltransferase